MTKQKQKYIRKSEQLTISISPYLREQLEELVELGLFSNVSDAVRHAIHQMIATMEAQGKLPSKKPPKTAEERTKNATHAGSREVEVD